MIVNITSLRKVCRFDFYKKDSSNRSKKIARLKEIFRGWNFPDNSLEWWFVPIKTGVFEDLNCKVVDKIVTNRMWYSAENNNWVRIKFFNAQFSDNS